jgi:hypothetical protein
VPAANLGGATAAARLTFALFVLRKSGHADQNCQHYDLLHSNLLALCLAAESLARAVPPAALTGNEPRLTAKRVQECVKDRVQGLPGGRPVCARCETNTGFGHNCQLAQQSHKRAPAHIGIEDERQAKQRAERHQTSAAGR